MTFIADIEIAHIPTCYQRVPGGTIDITVHQIQPDDTLKELYKANGGSWGGTYVDKAFRDLLADIVGNDVMDSLAEGKASDYFDLFRLVLAFYGGCNFTCTCTINETSCRLSGADQNLCLSLYLYGPIPVRQIHKYLIVNLVSFPPWYLEWEFHSDCAFKFLIVAYFYFCIIVRSKKTKRRKSF